MPCCSLLHETNKSDILEACLTLSYKNQKWKNGKAIAYFLNVSLHQFYTEGFFGKTSKLTVALFMRRSVYFSPLGTFSQTLKILLELRGAYRTIIVVLLILEAFK